jgi:hypothetical protein
VQERHVLGEFFLWDLLFDLQFSAFDTADIAVDNADVIFLADHFVALRMIKRVLHLHAFERLDDTLDVLTSLIPGLFDGLLECEDILPRLLAVALVHYTLAANFPRIDVVNSKSLVEFLVELTGPTTSCSTRSTAVPACWIA